MLFIYLFREHAMLALTITTEQIFHVQGTELETKHSCLYNAK